MQTELRLAVPAGDQSTRVIDEYYDFLDQQCVEADCVNDEYAETIEFQHEQTLSAFEDEGRFRVYERLHPDSRRVDAYHDIFDILEPCEYITYDRKRIEQVHRKLQTVERELVAAAHDGELDQRKAVVKRQFEIGPIAICEFALDHDYGVELMY